MRQPPKPPDALLDDVAAEIRDEAIDPRIVHEATGRVWSRIGSELGASVADVAGSSGQPLRSCSDVQTELPALVAGSLDAARARLVEDHTRECLDCRRALLTLRQGGERRAAAPAASRRPSLFARAYLQSMPRSARWALAATLLIGAVITGMNLTSSFLADQRLTAEVQVVDGSLLQIDAEGTSRLAPGAVIGSHQRIRTTRDSGAVVRLADGSVIEMAARSELALHANRRGTYVDLERGNVIVEAATQRPGHRLYVATGDCQVAVKGTIFSVNSGLRGSRVSVIEGEVEVRQGSGISKLLPGDQVSTDPKIEPVAVEKEIAWSRKHEQHIALLHQLEALNTDIHKAVDIEAVRTSTRLLDLAPADTAVWIAIPNLAEGIGSAYDVLQRHLAENDALRVWWQDQVVSSGLDAQIDELLTRLRPLGEAIGDELAAAIPVEPDAGDHLEPVLLAVLDDPATFTTLLADELDRLDQQHGETRLMLVLDPWQINPEDADWLLWVSGDILVATPSVVRLREVATALADPQGNPFGATTLHARLVDAYSDGVGWLVGMDVQRLLQVATIQENGSQQALLERIGLSDAETLVLERHREGTRASVQAELEFGAPRSGVAAWLIEPAPMGSLSFVSPDASVVAAAVTRDAVDLFDDMLDMASIDNPGILEELRRLQMEHGIDLRNELATALGGELALALDGPVLPIPSWKLVVEVYDPAMLQATIERAVDEVNRLQTDAGRPGLELTSTTSGGVTYHTLRHLGTGLSAVYAVVDGYLVAAPHQSLIETALRLRQAGTTLLVARNLPALLPPGTHNDCSALLYSDLSQLAQAVPESALANAPAELSKLVSGSAGPSLVCAVGEPTRITVVGSGPSLAGGLASLSMAAFLREIGDIDEIVAIGETAETVETAQTAEAGAGEPEHSGQHTQPRS